ncbi:F-box protein At3g07870 isoform X1 [Ricinus communis]|uniref:F-box protein At3g07870 isoform X1 n=1 Tax=Ricinus communis TaxID=3988 RepID=UPI00201AFB96|nr:F-box protein At3g07870 isoform X1 [Ricinus communis]
MLENIPQEILIEILKRVPVKSLLKCRCVCQSWHSLITNSSFISTHINHSIECNNRVHSYALVKQKSVPDCKERFILYIDDDSGDEPFRVYQELDFPFKGERYLEIISSCNGLVCLSDSQYARFYLWNPVIRKCLTILSSDSSFIVGFGFEYKKNDYKVVKIMHHPEKMNPVLIVKIYDLSTSAWRSITVENRTLLNFCFGDRKRAYSNGVFHWLARAPGKEGSPDKLTLASFDLGDEVFREMMFPDDLAQVNENHLSLVVYGESLALLQHLSWKSDDFSWSLGYYESCCIWVLKKHGEGRSWSKQYTFGMQDYGGLVRVLSFRKNGEVLLQIRSSELASYDPETNRVICHGGYPYRSYYKVHTYMESLLLL